MVDLFGKGMLGWVGRPGLTERGRKKGCHRYYVVVILLFYVHGKHLRSCRNCQLT